LEEARARILCVATTAVPEAKEARNMARRFELHGAAYFVSVPPTPSSNSLKDR
jgi:dihydrodipicolinate synthase/N-acetylneuraminate lyase